MSRSRRSRAGYSLTEYFKSQSRRVHEQLHDVPENRALPVLVAWIRRHGGACTTRELLRSNKFRNVGEVEKAIRELVARGYGRCEVRLAANCKNELVQP